MAVIRTSDRNLPKRERLCSILGNMLNTESSVETKKALAEAFFSITQGISPVEEILREFQLSGRMLTENNTLILEIDVPPEYVDPTLKLTPEQMKVRFIITRFTNVNNASSTYTERENTNE